MKKINEVLETLKKAIENLQELDKAAEPVKTRVAELRVKYNTLTAEQVSGYAAVVVLVAYVIYAGAALYDAYKVDKEYEETVNKEEK